MTSATKRLNHDYVRLKRDPVPGITAEPKRNNILEWHYVLKGPEGTPYEGGYYHGRLIFPADYPFRPPSIFMITPSGRFLTNSRLCLTISDFHPETWNPTWWVGAILNGLLSFMVDVGWATGAITTSDQEKRDLAAKSLQFNLNNSTFRELFPDICKEMEAKLRLKGIR